ncbi:RNAase [Candidatus Sumerlaeota bacterium]|nr:RNAase [Candidatus Sumerlaeota bacterium]
MHEILHRNLYFVKEHVGLFKAANNFDIFDPQTGEKIMECREPNLGFITKMVRFTEYKRMTPFDIEVRTTDGRQVCRIKRGISLFLSRVQVFDDRDVYVGGFQQKFFSVGGKFDVLDDGGRPVCTLKGKWTGWDFRFVTGETEFAHVTKKWAGLGKELFTTADNYILEINEHLPADHPVRQLILAAVMCIDMVLKE